MITTVEGNSDGTLEEYFRESMYHIKEKIDRQDHEVILDRNIDDLTEFFIQDYLLPIIQIDSLMQERLEKYHSFSNRGKSYVDFELKIPIILEEGVDKVVARRSNPYTIGSSRFGLEKGHMFLQIRVDSSTQNPENKVIFEKTHLMKLIGYKNQNVETGNQNLRNYTKNYLEKKKIEFSNEENLMNQISQKLNIKLEKKTNVPIIDLEVKKRIKILMPESRSKIEPQLEQETLNTIIELIKNQCRQFETTPKAFESMEEELLRDQILGMLNTVFPDATGESFVRNGKTDIRLKHPRLEGGILSSECKFWSGEKKYRETIDQHFNYLTWRQNYAIQITFSKKEGFTEVIEKACNASENHELYVKNSLKKIEQQHFVTTHLFPNDSQKKIEVHHLIFDLHIRNRK